MGQSRLDRGEKILLNQVVPRQVLSRPARHDNRRHLLNHHQPPTQKLKIQLLGLLLIQALVASAQATTSVRQQQQQTARSFPGE